MENRRNPPSENIWEERTIWVGVGNAGLPDTGEFERLKEDGRWTKDGGDGS